MGRVGSKLVNVSKNWVIFVDLGFSIQLRDICDKFVDGTVKIIHFNSENIFNL